MPVETPSPARLAALEALADRISALVRPRPIRVAIDGYDTAGKTTLADDLAVVLGRWGREVIRASIDGFHRPRAERYRRGRDSPLGYYDDSFDYRRLAEVLLDPLGPGGDGMYRPGVFDHRRDVPLAAPTHQAAEDAILIFDGVFLLRPELAGSWDLSVFLSVRPEARYRVRYLLHSCTTPNESCRTSEPTSSSPTTIRSDLSSCASRPVTGLLDRGVPCGSSHGLSADADAGGPASRLPGFFLGGLWVKLFEHELALPWRHAVRLGGSGRGERERGSKRQAVLVVGVMWLLGLVALAAVVGFDRRVDDARRAQLLIGQIRDQQGALLALAFDPAIASGSDAPGVSEISARVRQTKAHLDAQVASLARLGTADAPARIRLLDAEYYRLIDRLSDLVGHARSREAALELGASQRRGGVDARMDAELERADTRYESIANRSRTVASVGTVAAIVFLLLAFTVAFQYSLRARRRSYQEATTDALTGLSNRRKLFADMKHTLASLDRERTVSVGIYDLDGFKAYNDTFGHPAGDALLARLAARLIGAVGDHGSAYRIGGDEFVVVTAASDGEAVLSTARAALSEEGAGFSIGCSLGATQLAEGNTLEQALHVADQRLYANKRNAQSRLQSDVKDALLQVLVEQDENLVTHLAHVAVLAESTAVALGLPGEEVRRVKLAAELHDIGKAAIPSSILDKPGPLDEAERIFMQRHSAIGERIVAAAATLETIAPIVRSAHERADGSGYPDGLKLDQIPICSRIIAVVDAFDAMTNDRPYRRAASSNDALAELRRHAGTQFDPDVVEAFETVLVARDGLLQTAA